MIAFFYRIADSISEDIPPVVRCILVRYPDGTECWESELEYLRNPPTGSYIIRDSRKVRASLS